MRSARNYIVALVLVVCSSTATYYVTSSAADAAYKPAPADNENQVLATLYVQHAGEYRALAYQAYNIARWRLDEDLVGKNKKDIAKADRKKPRAIMVDIDETVLDNTPEQARRIVAGEGFENPAWYAWGEMRKAKAIPGAVDFINYAASRGVRVFFVSNRDEVQKQATMDNLKSSGFKDVSTDNVLLRQKDADGKNISTKEFRRESIRQKYRIVFFMGDNLDDHSNTFESPAGYQGSFEAERNSRVDTARDLFGKQYILLPNPIYGTWENVMYAGKLPKDPKDAREFRRTLLELP